MKKIIKTAVKAGSIIVTFIKFLFNISGARSIWLKFWPGKPGVPPTGPLWLIAIYIALYGIASQRYENRISIIENRANLITSQMNSPQWRYAIQRIPSVQRMPCPVKPEVLNPVSVLKSITSESYYSEIVDNLKEVIELKKDSLNNIIIHEVDLSSADLDYANLQGARLFDANLEGVILAKANLEGATLSKAVLKGATLLKANLSGAGLGEANLNGANLMGANFAGAVLRRANLNGANLLGANFAGAVLQEANLSEADISGANFSGAQLTKVIGLKKEQLLSANSLYNVIGLDQNLRKQLEEEKPALFKKPE